MSLSLVRTTTSPARRMLLLGLALTALLVGALTLPGRASAATRTFTGDTSSNWGTASNWNENAVPVAGDQVVIDTATDAGDDLTVTNVPTISLLNFTVLGGGDENDPQVLTGATATSQVTVTGNLSLSGGRYSNLGFLVSGTATGALQGDELDTGPVFTGSSAANGGQLQVAAGGELNVITSVTLDRHATFANHGTTTLGNAGGFFASTLYTGGAATSSGAGSAFVVDNAGENADASYIAVPLTAAATSSFSVTGELHVTQPLEIDGTFDNADSTTTVTNDADDSGSLTVVGRSDFSNNGDLQLQGAHLTLDGSTLHNQSEFELDSGASVTGGASAGALVNESDADIDVDTQAGSASLNVPTTNLGSFFLLSGTLSSSDQTLTQNASSGEFGSSVQLSGGTLNGLGLVLNSGSLSGHGTIYGSVTAGAGVDVTPRSDNAPGLLTINGSAHFLSGSTLHALDAGAGVAAAANGFSRLDVSGPATIDAGATLEVQTPESYVPAAGATFRPLTATTLTGGFSTYSGFHSGGIYGTQASNGTGTDVTYHVATFAVSASPVAQGATVFVTGAGFLPGELVDVSMLSLTAQSENEKVANITLAASAAGDIAGSFVLPATLPPGLYHPYYVARTSNATDVRDLTVVAKPAVVVPDTDGDGLLDNVDCAPLDKTRPARGAGVTDVDCNGVPDAVQPVVLVGKNGNDVLVGKGGADSIKGGNGNDTLSGAGGNDKLSGGNGNDRLSGGDGNDALTGDAGNDTLSGGNGNDTESGGAGSDRITGENGNDTITGGAGRDTESGGAGNDRISDRDHAVDTITCGTGKDTVVADKVDKVSKDCEKVTRR